MSFVEKIKEKFFIDRIEIDKNINREIIGKANMKANRFFMELSILCMLIDIVIIVLTCFGVFVIDNIFVTIIPYSFSLLMNLILIIICFNVNLANVKLKYILVSLFMLAEFGISIYLGFAPCLLFIIPIVISIMYYDYKFTIITCILSELLIVVSMFLSSYIWYKTGYYDLYFFGLPMEQIVEFSGKTYIDLQGLTFDTFSSYLSLSTGVLLISYTIIIGVVSFIAILSTKRGKEMLSEQSRISAAKSKSEQEAQEAKMRIMISQIQPHFLYNTLNSIYYLIEKDPNTAQQAVSDFSDYLRENLNVKNNSELIPFSKELSHIRKYLSLEKIRFEEELKYVFDIKFKNFRVPALSIQPLVENAVKHGVCRKVGGGTIKISSIEKPQFFQVTVEDNGVGFDPKAPLSEDRSHIGLGNTRMRLENILGAKMSIESKIGHGTKITIQIPKENYYEDSSN